MPTPFLLNGILASQISGHLYSGPAGAFDALGSVTVGSGGLSSITFSAIPQTYTHLQIRATWATSSASETLVIFNGDSTGTDYYRHYLQGSGSAAQVGSLNLNTMFGYYGTSGSIYTSSVMDILDYTSANKNKTTKTMWGYDANGSGYVGLTSGLWSNLSAINSITLTAGAGSFNQYTNFSLYGIR